VAVVGVGTHKHTDTDRHASQFALREREKGGKQK